MKRSLLALGALITTLAATAATHSCQYFTIDTPDDSWTVTPDHGLGDMGARMMVSRNDGTQGLTHLARIDYVDRPFTPASYLTSQVVNKRDNFTHSAVNIGTIADTTFAGYNAKYVNFDKDANGSIYHFAAIAFNAGWGTYFIIQGQQDDAASIVGRITSSVKPVASVQLTSLAQLVEAGKESLARRRAAWDDGGEKLMAVSLPDDATVQLDIEVPFVTAEAIDLPTFIQTKRKNWIKHRKEVALRDGIIDLAKKEGRSIKYVYRETRGKEIGTMVILLEEIRD